MAEHFWPSEIKAVFERAVARLDGDMMPLLYGPAHIVWEDENFDHAQWCLTHFDQGDLTAFEADVVRDSLVELVALTPEGSSYGCYLNDDGDPRWIVYEDEEELK